MLALQSDPNKLEISQTHLPLLSQHRHGSDRQHKARLNVDERPPNDTIPVPVTNNPSIPDRAKKDSTRHLSTSRHVPFMFISCTS